MAKRSALVDREAFARAARTAGDHRLARRFGIGRSTARRYRLAWLGPRAPLPANPSRLGALERRVIAACWGHVPPGELAGALGRAQRTVSLVARRDLGLPAWERRATNRKATPARVREYLTRIAAGERPICRLDRAMGWSSKTGRLVRRGATARTERATLQPAASAVLWRRCPACCGMVLGRGQCVNGCQARERAA